jgi:hypothetical protein
LGAQAFDGRGHDIGVRPRNGRASNPASPSWSNAGSGACGAASGRSISRRRDSVFRHFPHKEDLVFHRHGEQVGRFAALLAEQPDERPALEALIAALAAMLRLDEGHSDSALLRLLDQEPELQRRDAQLIADHHAAAVTFLQMRGADLSARNCSRARSWARCKPRGGR